MIAPFATLAFTVALATASPGAPAAAARQGGGGTGPVQAGVLVRPDTVTVGDPFTVVIRVRAIAGALVAFPTAPDSGGTVEGVDPRVVRVNPDPRATDETATYRVVAWRTGTDTVPLGPITIVANGVRRTLAASAITVAVRSVLPADTALRTPRPARAIVAAPRALGPWIAAVLAVLVAASMLIWWRARRRQRPPVPPDAAEGAARAFARIDRLRLLEAGEPGRYVALHADVVRDYFARRYAAAARALTTHELLEALRDTPAVDAGPLAALLGDADLIKFARRPVTANRARALGAAARALVIATERALAAPDAAATTGNEDAPGPPPAEHVA